MSTDDLFHSTFMVETESDNSGKTAFPEFPGEKPSKLEIKNWLDKWGDGLNASGYGALLRGEVPYDLKKLAARPLLTIPESAEPARKLALETENEKIKFQNTINEEERESRLIELRNRLASNLKNSGSLQNV